MYEQDAQIDELHSRIGTQIPLSNLPTNLQDHYRQYFTSPDIGPFRAEQEKQDELAYELEQEKAAIDQQSQDYYSKASELSARIDRFNACAETVDCFKSDAEFDRQRAALLAEQSNLEEIYNDLNTTIEDYNKKVEEYNNSVLRTKDLENAINSNAAPEKLDL